MGHTNGGDYHEASYCCPGCGRAYQYDTRRTPHWSPSRPLIGDELSKVFPTDHCGFEKMCKHYSGYKPCRLDRCEFRCASHSAAAARQQIILTPNCPDCKEDPAWTPDWLCKNTKPDIYQSCINNRKEGKCPKNIPLFEEAARQQEPFFKGKGTFSTYGDQNLGEGMSYPQCRFAGKFHKEENDCNCCHPNTGDVFFCATHHIAGQPPCPGESNWLHEHDAAIAQAAREDERRKMLAEDCDYRITTMINGGSRVYVYPGGILPKQPADIFQISKADREGLYKMIETLRITTTAPGNRIDSAEQRIADVIAELERRRDGAGDAGDYVAQSLYNEAISLLKNDVGMDGV